jgi:hypothetical protein
MDQTWQHDLPTILLCTDTILERDLNDATLDVDMDSIGSGVRAYIFLG